MVSSPLPVIHATESVTSRTKGERGASMVEYALLVALIAVVAIASLRVLGNTTAGQFAQVVTELGGKVPAS